MLYFAQRLPPPSPQDMALANASMRVLLRHTKDEQTLKFRPLDNEQDEIVELPPGAVALLKDILRAMALGQAITLIPEHAELTTVQAANVLNVSRPFLIKLLEAGAVPYHKVGKHRRVRMEDVMSYKRRIDEARAKILDELVADAQEHQMGYE